MCCVGSGGWCGLILGKGFLWWSARRHPGVPAWAPLPPARFHLPAQGRRAGVCTPSSPMVSFALTLTRSQRPPPPHNLTPQGGVVGTPPPTTLLKPFLKTEGLPIDLSEPHRGEGTAGGHRPNGEARALLPSVEGKQSPRASNRGGCWGRGPPCLRAGGITTQTGPRSVAPAPCRR